VRSRIVGLVAALLVGVASYSFAASPQDLGKTLMPQTTISVARTAVLEEVVRVPLDARVLGIQAVFAYGSGGTTVKAWVQTSFDGGTTWVDIANFAFTTAAARAINSVRTDTAVAANYTATDGTLADNTIKDGLLGDRLRVKWTTTGTYGGTTNLKISVVIR
jgi:hypothetical protein